MESIPPLLNAPVNRRRWWIHLLLITGYLLLVGMRGLGRQKSHGPALLHSARGLLLVCGLEVAIFGTVFGLACLASRPTRDDLRLRWRGTVAPVALGMGYSVALRLALGMVVAVTALGLVVTHLTTPTALQSYMLANRPDVEALVDISALRNNPVYFWLTLTVASFGVAGLREELWRSAFLAGMAKLWPHQFGSRSGQIGAVFVGAIIFGSAHLSMGVLAAGMAGLLGIGLGLIMVLHRSIWPAVIAHGLFDATTFAMLPWAMGHLPKF
jgi:membrane protease YdiL (CAAX protease family)